MITEAEIIGTTLIVIGLNGMTMGIILLILMLRKSKSLNPMAGGE